MVTLMLVFLDFSEVFLCIWNILSILQATSYILRNTVKQKKKRTSITHSVWTLPVNELTIFKPQTLFILTPQLYNIFSEIVHHPENTLGKTRYLLYLWIFLAISMLSFFNMWQFQTPIWNYSGLQYWVTSCCFFAVVLSLPDSSGSSSTFPLFPEMSDFRISVLNLQLFSASKPSYSFWSKVTSWSLGIIQISCLPAHSAYHPKGTS